MSDNNLGELGQYGDKIPVSAAAVGATLGLVGGPPGVLVGAIVGGVIDLVRLIGGAKQKLKALEKEYFRELLRRYNSTVFVTALERLGPAMLHLVSLGVKPNTQQFEDLLVKKLIAEIGYKGNCKIDLFAPAPPGQPKPLVAQIDSRGNVYQASPNFRLEHGQQWLTACKEYHKVALQAWADEQAEQIKFERNLAVDREAAKRQNVTKILVNSGLIIFIIGYTLRQKKKIRGDR